jgi:hypothetical protein
MGARWRARAAAAGIAAFALGAACAAVTGRSPPPPPDPDLRIWTAGVVHWGPESERSVRFAIENGTFRTLAVHEPDPARARVVVYAGDGGAIACAVEPKDPPAGDGETVKLAPGDSLPVRVDLERACGDLRPGEYRYELGYRLPPAEGKAGLALQTRYGILLVEGQPRSAAGRSGTAPKRPPTPRR